MDLIGEILDDLRAQDKGRTGVLKNIACRLRIQGSGQHIGKSPKGKPASEVPSEPVKERQKSELELLQEKLRKAIHDEAFEEAAKLRDKIRAFEKKPPKSGPEKESHETR